MSRIRSLSINEMNKGMNWIHQNLTEFATENNANYQYSRCLDKLGGLLSSHTRETTKRYHYWFRAREEQTFSNHWFYTISVNKEKFGKDRAELLKILQPEAFVISTQFVSFNIGKF